MSQNFFDQEQAILELDLPRVKIHRWKEQLSKGEKIAVKLEIKKNNAVELRIVDDRDHIFVLNGYKKKTEQSLLLNDKKAIGIVQYKSRSTRDEYDTNLENLGDQLIKQNISKDPNKQIFEADDEEDEIIFFRKDPLKLAHTEILTKLNDSRPTLPMLQPIQVKQTLLDYFREYWKEGVTITSIQRTRNMNYDQKDLKKILDEIATKKRERNETKYFLKDQFKYREQF